MPFRGISIDDEGSIIYDGEKFIVNHPSKVPDNFDPGDKPVVGLPKTHPSHPQNRKPSPIPKYVPPSVIYTAFDKHRANEHQRRVEEASGDEGTPISGADLSFYLHEQAEFHIMRQVVDKNMTLREMTENYPLEVITFEPDMIRRNNLLGTPLSELPEDIRNVASYKYAHERALDLYQVSRYSVYHPKVLYRNQEEFSNRYFEFWGIDKQG